MFDLNVPLLHKWIMCAVGGQCYNKIIISQTEMRLEFNRWKRGLYFYIFANKTEYIETLFLLIWTLCKIVSILFHFIVSLHFSPHVCQWKRWLLLANSINVFIATFVLINWFRMRTKNIWHIFGIYLQSFNVKEKL